MISRMVLVAAATLGMLAGTAPASQKKPKGFKQILRRGTIASIDDPKYVPASEARMAPSAWVLGAVIDGQAFAYNLDLLNTHEVVNDSVGDTNFAAVW